MAMTEQENAMFADMAQSLGAVALAFGAALAVVNAEIPDFRERVLKSLDRAIDSRPDLAHNPNGAAIMATAKALIAGLAKT